MMRHLVFFILCWWLLSGTAQAQILADLVDLPVRWQATEKWDWQGQRIYSQRFDSDQSVMELTQQIQQRLPFDLRIQRLPSAWVVSFDDNQTHYLLLLSEQAKGSAGWLSSLSLSQMTSQVPTLFNHLYLHSWILQEDENQPTYFVLQASRPQAFEQQLIQRLQQRKWQRSSSCHLLYWCQWQLADQTLLFWPNSARTLWYVLWWNLKGANR